MHTRSMLALLLVLTLATAASAKMKLSGEETCPKPDPQYTIEVGDQPNHSFQLSKVKCTYAKAPEVGGVAAASYESVSFTEISGDTSRSRGVAIVSMANGDKLYVPWEAKGTAQGSESRWTFAGGTGKFSGIKGKGTSKGKATADGGTTAVVQGTYTLPK